MHSDIDDLDEVTNTFLFQRKNNNKNTLNISSNFSVLRENTKRQSCFQHRERERETLFIYYKTVYLNLIKNNFW